MSAVIHPCRASDMADVLRIQSRCYFQMEPESEAALLSRVTLSPQSCWLARVDGVAAGYLLTHPWYSDSPPPLDTVLPARVDDADCLYLHDLAIDPAQRGRGVAQLLVRAALDAAHEMRMRRCALVAVQDSQPFWSRHGFEPAPTALAREKLASYGGVALLMWRDAACDASVAG